MAISVNVPSIHKNLTLFHSKQCFFFLMVNILRRKTPIIAIATAKPLTMPIGWIVSFAIWTPSENAASPSKNPLFTGSERSGQQISSAGQLVRSMLQFI